MNERINELFEQALEEFKAEHQYATIIVPNPLKEKFAKLIVRECAELVKDFYQEDEFTCYSARTEIKEHFGVE